MASESSSRNFWKTFDYPLILVTLLICVIGLAMIHSAAYSIEQTTSLFDDTLVIKQTFYLVAGLVGMTVVGALDYRIFRGMAAPLYLFMLALLAIVLVTGQIGGGSQRWINLGFFQLQPSELAKFIMVIVLARFFSDRQASIRSPVTFIMSLMLVVIPMALIYKQPDLGTALALGAIWLVLGWVAGVPFRYTVLIGLVFLLAMPWIWTHVLQDYMRDRIILFLNPEADPLGAGYNVNQARIAIGSGGWLGKGFMMGTQNQLQFLRVRYSDFIFSVLGEELGFVGGVLLFSLLSFVIIRILQDASKARDGFGMLLACGVAIIILSQSLINLSVNLGLMPVTGIPLPYVSYGGSSLISLLAAQGLVHSILVRPKQMEF
ncbi:MAG: rod shape-determining protein RodA [Chloroflexi bacterium]|nr:rod shape-determining protein RodA [Chloroflexota bacterium]